MTSRLVRRVLAPSTAIVVVAATLGAAPLQVDSVAAATAVAPIQRVAGNDRIATSVAVSAQFWAEADHVIIASASNFPDALAGSPLAADRGAPLLLSDPTDLRADVAAEVRRLTPQSITVLGGPAAISESVVAALGGIAPVRRLAGQDRFETAAAIAVAAGASDNGDVVLALGSADDPGRAWPDALSAASLTSTPDRPPLLLTESERLPEPTLQALTTLRRGDGLVHLLGGTSAIRAEVEQQLRDLGHPVSRLAGNDRYQTSLDVATVAMNRRGQGTRPIVFATGAVFADGLAAGALAARLDAALVLVPPVVTASLPATQAWLTVNSVRFSDAVLLGGQAAVNDDVVGQLHNARGAAVLPLPAPVPPPALPPAAAAASIVAQLSDSESTADRSAVLLGAAPTWGFTVLAGDGHATAVPSGQSQGITLSAYELQALAQAAPQQLGITFQEIIDEVMQGLPEAAGQPVADLLLRDVASAAVTEDTALSRWAWAVVEAGRTAPEPHDLLAPGIRAADVRPTALQLSLIQLRLGAEGLARARADGVDVEAPLDQANDTRSVVEPPTRHPCTPAGSDATILEWASVTASTAFGEFWGWAAEVPSIGRTLAGWGKLLPHIGLFLQYVQTMVNVGFTDLTASIAPDPLVRSKDLTAGEPGIITVTLTTDTGKLQVLNCARIGLNTLGMDLTIPPDGKIDGTVSAVGEGRTEALLQFQAGEVTSPRPRPTTNGAVQWKVEGKPQRTQLPEDSTPVMKDDRWRFGVVVEPNNILKDFRDAGTSAIGAIGAPMYLVLGLPAKLIAKSTLFTTFTKSFPVQDWCASPDPDRCRLVTGSVAITYSSTFADTWDESTTAAIDLRFSYRQTGPDLWYYGDDGSTWTISGTNEYSCGEDCHVSQRWHGTQDLEDDYGGSGLVWGRRTANGPLWWYFEAPIEVTSTRTEDGVTTTGTNLRRVSFQCPLDDGEHGMLGGIPDTDGSVSVTCSDDVDPQFGLHEKIQVDGTLRPPQ